MLGISFPGDLMKGKVGQTFRNIFERTAGGHRELIFQPVSAQSLCAVGPKQIG